MKNVLIAYALLLLVCAGLTVAGVFILTGLGWSLVAGGGFFLAFSEILRRGMTGVSETE